MQSIRSLSGKGVSSITVLSASDSRPAGCVVFAVSSAAAVFLHVKGRVDIDGEISKATKKLEKTKQGIERQNKILGDEGYKEKVSAELQEVERRKLADLEVEMKGFEETIRQFEGLKME
jgi:valyl-tRNA synthetase